MTAKPRLRVWPQFMMLATIACLSIGCGTGRFARVPFDYDSLDHIEPSRSIVSVAGDPETIAFKISAVMREAGGSILMRERVDHIPVVPPEAEACWAALNETTLAEFETFRANDWDAYEDIDENAIYARHSVSPGCGIVKTEDRPGADAWVVKAELDERSASTSYQQLKSFAMSIDPQGGGSSGAVEHETVTESLGFSSRLFFHIWRNGSGESKVLVKAFPVQGTVQACSSCQIGYDFWQEVTAEREANLARNYLALIEELGREGAFKPVADEEADLPQQGSSVSQAPGAAPLCAPGQSIACAGPGGCQGFQVCANDGGRFEPCKCGGP